MREKSFHGLLVEQLKDLHSAEKQITEALPKMIEAASNGNLREAFDHHLDQTRGHIERLDRILKGLGETPGSVKCEGMEGLLKEGDKALEMGIEGVLLDALLIAGAQRVEHYEIAGYGTARAWAEELDLDDAADLLGETLDEEGDANKKLTAIAEGGLLEEGVNEVAQTR